MKKSLPFVAIALGLVFVVLLGAAMYLDNSHASTGEAVLLLFTNCTDSDTGIKPYNVGTVTYMVTNKRTEKSANKVYTDSCTNVNQVKEWYCEGSRPQSIFVTCDGGRVCHDGRCVLPTNSAQ